MTLSRNTSRFFKNRKYDTITYGFYEWEKLSNEYDRKVAKDCEWPGEIEQKEFAKGERKKNLLPSAYFFKKDTMLKTVKMTGFEVNIVMMKYQKNIKQMVKSMMVWKRLKYSMATKYGK